MPYYAWQRKFIESDNRVNLLTAANQIGKSSALIRRAIRDATDRARWKRLWGVDVVPRQLWYFYPDSKMIDKEMDTKWIPEWLPRGDMKRDPVYGWTSSRKSGAYDAIRFNTGVTIYFQSYSKKLSSVQAGSVYEIFADEELPIAFYDELMFRLAATNGIFSSGFTPTLNQIFWKQALETDDILPTALKMMVSMYDCLTFDNGMPSLTMSLEKIKLVESRCNSETEKQRRVFGRFVTESGRSFYAFSFDENVVKDVKYDGWYYYAAVDYGSGTDNEAVSRHSRKNHPAAIVVIAVRPDYKKGVVVFSWRGDEIKTTAGDVFNKYQEIVKGLELNITQACYDSGAKDFGTIAGRNGVSFVMADKKRDAGEDLVNTLFKHKMLDILEEGIKAEGDLSSENMKLINELLTIMISRNTTTVKKGDDLADALRYCVMQVPWDLSAIVEKNSPDVVVESKPKVMTDEEFAELQIKLRRGENVRGYKDEQDGWGELEREFDYWNDQF